MALTPIGNSGYGFLPAAQANSINPVASKGKPDMADLINKPCETWKRRTYQDRSSDPTVSMQTPTHLSPDAAAAAVAQHENQHVAHEKEKAERNGQTVHSTVTIKTSVCPEWGRIYVSGGETRTTISDTKKTAPSQEQNKGSSIDIRV